VSQLIEVQNRALAAKMAITGCGRETALKAGALLVGGYANLQIHDAAAFKEHLVIVMQDYPADLCQQAAIAIPQAERYLNVAAVKAWLEERMHERRQAYAEAVEAQRKAEEDTREARHAEQVTKDREAFNAWLEDHPGGTMRQYLGFQTYAAPFQMDEEPKAFEMGPYPSAGHLMSERVKDLEP